MRWNSRKKHRQHQHNSKDLAQKPAAMDIRTEVSKKEEQPTPLIKTEFSEEEALCKLISIHRDNPLKIQNYSRAQLRRQQRHIDILFKNKNIILQEHIGKQAEEYRHCVIDELQARRQRTRRLLITLCIIASILVIALLVFMRGRKAELLKEQIYQSIYSQNSEDILHSIQQAEQFIYYINNAALHLHVTEAKAWLGHQQEQQKKGHQLLDQLENQSSSIESLREDESRSLAQLFSQTSKPNTALQQRWKRLIKKTENQHSKAKLKLIQQVYAPLPHPICLSGNIDIDERVIKSDINKLKQRIALFDENQKFHGQAQHIVQIAQNRLLRQETELHELQKLRKLQEKINLVRDYQSYRKILLNFNAHSYPLACKVNQIWSIIPREEKLDRLLMHHKKAQSYEESLATEKSILYGASSFSAAFPANAHMIALMGEIFDARSLNTPLYLAISQKNAKDWLSDEPIKAPRHGKFIIAISPLSPNYKPGEKNKYIVTPDERLKVYHINCLPFLQELQITRADFFDKSNLAVSAEEIIKSSHPDCPTLAKAYILQQVFKVIENYPHNDISGLVYSKTLQKDIFDFKRILKQHHITLNNISWLKREKKYKAAELILKKWYKKLANRDYQREMQTQFLKTLSAKPCYIGYIKLDGKAQFHQNPMKGTTLWFVKKGAKKLHYGKHSELNQAAILSPILINNEACIKPKKTHSSSDYSKKNNQPQAVLIHTSTLTQIPSLTARKSSGKQAITIL